MRRWKRLALLLKTEATYATDAAPAAADAIIASNITFTPLEGEEVRRDLMLPWLGNQAMRLTATYGRLEFDVEIAGAGTAGTAPRYSSILRSAGLAATIQAGTSVTYSIVETGVESATVHFVSDGVRHVFLGGHANLSLSFAPKQIPKFRVTYTGLLGPVTDAALPTVATTGWITPVEVSRANTTLSLHGWSAIAESLTIELGNTVTPRHLIGDERILITDRQSTGTAVVEAKSIATIDWFARARAATTGALSLIHGTTAGNIVEVTAPAVQIGKPAQGQTDNIVNYSLPLMLLPVSGRDELTIVVR